MRHPDSSLAAYVEGTATSRERATAEAHLATCVVCRKEVTRARRARTALASLGEVESPGIDVAVVMQLAEATRTRSAAQVPAKATEGAVGLPAPVGPTADTRRLAEVTAAGTTPGGEPAAAAEGASVTQMPAEGERVRKRRERDRAWQLRLVQGALGAAAVLVAIVLFVGLRNPPVSTPQVARDQAGDAGSAPEAPSTLESGQAFTVDSFDAYARQQAEEARTNDAVLQARDDRALAATPRAGADASVEDEAIACINQASELVGGTHLYTLIQGTVEGRPVHVGAFLSQIESESPVLLVIAASVDGCELVRLAREPL
jgi:Putative zinc-finger